MRTKQNLFLLIMSFFMLFIINQGITVTNAAAEPSVDDVFKNTPAGLPLGQYMESKDYPNPSGGTVKNYATVYKAGSKYGNSSDFVQMLDGSTDASDTQLSSIWGTRHIGEDDDNYFDLSKNQTVSAWIYFGNKDPYEDIPGTSSDTTTGLPDGLAFVLQNDKSGVTAIAKSNKKAFAPNPGESLGVWGNANQTTDKTNPALSSYFDSIGVSAIQNSLAVEFDTLRNSNPPKYNTANLWDPDNGYYQDSYFDGMNDSHNSVMASGQHMAWAYPAGNTKILDNTDGLGINDKYNTYYRMAKTSLVHKTMYYYGMDHKGVLPGMYITGYATPQETGLNYAWRHFEFQYTAPTDGTNNAKIRYSYNDRNYDGTPKPYLEYNKSGVQDIDIGELKANDQMEDSKNPNHVRWGFTASTGSPESGKSDFAIVMQEMPNVANIASDTKLFDLSQYDDNGKKGREISDISKATVSKPQTNPAYNVGNGDSLRFDYDLNYISGFAGTGNEITTTMNMPKNVDFVPDPTTDLGKQGYIGQIVYSGYPNAADNKTVPISGTSLSSDNTADRTLTLTLNQMKAKDENAKIELFGKASAVTTWKKVDMQHTAYRSMHYINDVASPSFIINDKLRLNTKDSNLDLGTINTAKGDKVNLNLKTDYEDGSAFDKTGLKLYTQIDDKTPTAQTVNTSDGQKSYDLPNNVANSTELSAATLGVGEHTIKVYEIDSMNRASDEITYKVNVEGKQLSLDVDEKGDAFKTVNSKPADGFVRRSGKWKVNVSSADTAWSLTASGGNLKLNSDPTQEIGPMFYRNKKNDDFTLNGGTPIIASDTSTVHPLQVTDVSGNWGVSDGILLRDTSTKIAGVYTGEISWNLTDSVL